MKKSITKIVAFMFILSIIVSACPIAMAQTVNVGGLVYVISGNTAEVNAYNGNGGDVVIPSKVNGVPVTSIGNYAFAEEYGVTEDSKRITSVTMPDTITKIGQKAFMECTSLKKVEMSSSVTTLGDALFWECINLEKVLVFSETVNIGENVFSKCPKLTVYCEAGSTVEKYATSNGVPVKPIYPSAVTVDKTEVVLNKNGSCTVKSAVTPSDCYVPDVYWVSDNKSIASVDATGKISAGKFGKTKVHCYSLLGNVQATVCVSVEVPKVSQVTCKNRTLTGYTIKWKKVKNADGYRLQKYVNSQWKTVKTLTKTTYTFKKLEEGSSCKYRVRAYTNEGSKKVWGAWSNILTASTKCVGKIKGLKVSDCTSSSIKLKWNKDADADGYEIYRLNVKTNKYEKIKTTTKGTFKDESLSVATQYKYKVRGYMKVDGKRKYGKYSSVLTASTAPGKVKGVKSGNATKSTLTVKWSKTKNANGYQISVTGTNYNKTFTTEKTSYTLTGLTKNTTYTIKVRAYITVSKKKYYGAYSSSAHLSTNYMPTSVVDIVAEYNEALSKTASSQTFYATKTDNVIADISNSNITDRYALNTVKALIGNYTGASSLMADFLNGTEKTSGVTAPVFFTGNTYAKALPASCVKKATFKKDGSGYAVTLELKSEKVNDNTQPKNNSALSPMIDWQSVSEDISSDVTVKSILTNYTATVVKAKINQFGKFDTITVTAPFTASINGDMNGKNYDVTVQGKKIVDFVISW